MGYFRSLTNTNIVLSWCGYHFIWTTECTANFTGVNTGLVCMVCIVNRWSNFILSSLEGTCSFSYYFVRHTIALCYTANIWDCMCDILYCTYYIWHAIHLLHFFFIFILLTSFETHWPRSLLWHRIPMSHSTTRYSIVDSTFFRSAITPNDIVQFSSVHFIVVLFPFSNWIFGLCVSVYLMFVCICVCVCNTHERRKNILRQKPEKHLKMVMFDNLPATTVYWFNIIFPFFSRFSTYSVVCT